MTDCGRMRTTVDAADNEDVARRLIVALDFSTRDQAIACVEKLAGLGVTFKVGLQLNTAAPEVVNEVVAAGEQVFLDLKFHDIPNTVAGAADSATHKRVWMFNVHALGGKRMMVDAVHAARNAANTFTDQLEVWPLGRPFVIAVTVLTSMDGRDLEDVGIDDSPSEEALRLSRLAAESGLDGVVTSAHEAQSLREAHGDGFILIVPGIRFAEEAKGDQKRVATPYSAIRKGASRIVMGRSITAATDSAAAARRALEEINNALQRR